MFVGTQCANLFHKLLQDVSRVEHYIWQVAEWGGAEVGKVVETSIDNEGRVRF